MSVRNATNTLVTEVPRIIQRMQLMQLKALKSADKVRRIEEREDESKRKRRKVETGQIADDPSGRTHLHMAAGSGKPLDVQRLIEAQAEIDAKDQHGFTPLMYAVRVSGNADCVDTLIKARANVNAIAGNSMTPLHLAMYQCDPKILKLLLNAKANVSQIDDKQNTPLHVAAMNGHHPGRTRIDCVPKERDLPQYGFAAKLLIQAGAKVNSVNYDGDTPLQIAARQDSVNVATELIRASPRENLEAVNKFGCTPLLVAIQHFRRRETGPTVAMLLIQAGVNVGVVDSVGDTPLHYAAGKDMTMVMNSLLRRQKFQVRHLDFSKHLVRQINSYINLPDKKGDTPLHCAVLYGGFQGAKVLLSEGAFVDAVDNNGCTPLHEVVKRFRETLHCLDYDKLLVVRLLIEYKANKNKTDNHGNTPISIAAQKNKDLVEFLQNPNISKLVDACRASGR